MQARTENSLKNLIECNEINFSILYSGGRGVTIGPIVSNYSDIFCDNERGSNFLWENDGYGQFNDVAKEVEIPDSNENGRGVTLSDFNNDGKVIFLKSTSKVEVKHCQIMK